MRTIEEVVSELSSELIRFLNEPIDQSRRVKANLDHLKCGKCLNEIVEIHKAEKDDLLDKIRAEIESNMESIIGKYDSSIPKSNMPSYKIERNKARKECISIIDKYKAESEDKE